MCKPNEIIVEGPSAFVLVTSWVSSLATLPFLGIVGPCHSPSNFCLLQLLHRRQHLVHLVRLRVIPHFFACHCTATCFQYVLSCLSPFPFRPTLHRQPSSPRTSSVPPGISFKGLACSAPPLVLQFSFQVYTSDCAPHDSSARSWKFLEHLPYPCALACVAL